VPTVEGQELLALPPVEVWRVLNDPDVLARAIPGCSGFERLPDSRFATTLTVVVGPVRGVYEGTVEYRDVEPPNRCSITVQGRGDQGTIAGTGAISLAPAGEGTAVAYEGSFKITGRVATVGQRMVPGVSRRLIVDTLRNLEAEGAAAD
jgi:uncharacterized protein